MGKLDATKMSEVEKNRTKRAEDLKILTATSFDLSNPEHTKTLKSYIDNFELSANKMYLFQSMSAGINTWGGSWVVGFILPIPEFAKYFLTACLYLGTAGYILESFSMTDFFEQLNEMKVLYNWCLKGGKTDYSPAIDNTEIIANPNVQRMIKLMAPLCSTEFMLAWPKESTVENQKGDWNLLSAGYSVLSSSVSFISNSYSVLSSSVSFFSAPKKPDINLNRIRELKIGVETGSLEIGVYNGFKQSIEYFATSPEFRELMAAKIKQPIDMLKNLVPAAIMENVAPKVQ